MKLIKGIYFPDSDTHFEHVIDKDGNYQKEQFETALKYIKPEDRGLFIDVGAHVGLWSRMAIKAGFKKLLCFEPNEENYKCLQENLNKIDDIDIQLMNAALSDKYSFFEMIKEKEDNSGSITIKEGYDLTKSEFPCFRFDLLIKPTDYPDCVGKILIKIDVQGHEAKVIKGMTDFIKEYKPIIIVEQFLNGKEDLEATNYCKSLEMKILERVKKEVILGW